MDERATILSMVKEVRETSDPAEAMRLLSTGIWIGFGATNTKFCLGRISGLPGKTA